jgi:hypothetical protein
VFLEVGVVNQRVSYVASKEMLRQNKEGYIMYFYVCNDSTDFITVYVTDPGIRFIAKIPVDELR